MGTHKNFNSAFKAMYRKLNSVKSSLPNVIANEGTRFFISSFDNEGFTDGTLKKWETPQRKIQGTKAFKYPKKKDLGRRTRKTLVKTGTLKRAVNNSVTQKSFKKIVWRVDLPYAYVHNNGEGKMPERKFMGESKTLNTIFKRKIILAYKKALA